MDKLTDLLPPTKPHDMLSQWMIRAGQLHHLHGMKCMGTQNYIF